MPRTSPPPVPLDLTDDPDLWIIVRELPCLCEHWPIERLEIRVSAWGSTEIRWVAEERDGTETPRGGTALPGGALLDMALIELSETGVARGALENVGRMMTLALETTP